MTVLLRTALARAADLCWPRRCAVPECGRPVDRPGRHICSRCHANLPWLEGGGACRTCGCPIPAEISHEFVCDSCKKLRPAFEFARSAVRYADPAARLIKDFKFRGALWLRDDLVDLLEAAVRARLECAAIDAVVPVPLHPFRRIARGFNQSAVLAKALAARLARRYDPSSLRRRFDTEHQTRLSDKKAREKNIRNAFAVRRPEFVRGRTILLVDDVMTTGGTLSECARPLVAAGAARVWCATVARA